jgi:hypothetical protein
MGRVVAGASLVARAWAEYDGGGLAQLNWVTIAIGNELWQKKLSQRSIQLGRVVIAICS